MDGNMSIQETENGNDRESFHRRSKLDISLDALRAVAKGIEKPTRIMYAVGISWNPLQKVLRSMVSAGFIMETESKGDKRTMRQYNITQSGLNVLTYLDRDKDFLRLMESTHST